MNAMLAEMNQAAAAGLAALLNTLWYGGAVVVLAWVGLRLCPCVNAATRYWIWTAVLGFLIVLPFLPSVVKQARAALLVRPERPAVIEPLAKVPAAPVKLRQIAPVTLTVSNLSGSNDWPLWLAAVWIVAAGKDGSSGLNGARSARVPGGSTIRSRTGLGGSEASFISPISSLTQFLSQLLGRTVLDETGLKGRYTFTLKWTPDLSQGEMFGGPEPRGSGSGFTAGAAKAQSAPEAPSAPGSSASSGNSEPSIFTALQQQLGLKLKPEKGPVEVLVIDHVEQPTAN
jgi:hypothetical protein